MTVKEISCRFGVETKLKAMTNRFVVEEKIAGTDSWESVSDEFDEYDKAVVFIDEFLAERSGYFRIIQIHGYHDCGSDLGKLRLFCSLLDKRIAGLMDKINYYSDCSDWSVVRLYEERLEEMLKFKNDVSGFDFENGSVNSKK